MNLLLEGDDLEALLLRAHREGGTSARIVRAEKVRRGGVLGFFAREGFEVAVEIPKSAEPDGEPDFGTPTASSPTPTTSTPAPTQPTPAQPAPARPATLLELAERTSAAERAAARAVALQAAYATTTSTPPPPVVATVEPAPAPVTFAPTEFPKAEFPEDRPWPRAADPLDSEWSPDLLTLNDLDFAADVPTVNNLSTAGLATAATAATAGDAADAGDATDAELHASDAELWFNTAPALPAPRMDVDSLSTGSPRPQFTHLIDHLREGVGLGRHRSDGSHPTPDRPITFEADHPVDEDLSIEDEPAKPQPVEPIAPIGAHNMELSMSGGIPPTGAGTPRATTVVPRHKPRRGGPNRSLPTPRPASPDAAHVEPDIESLSPADQPASAKPSRPADDHDGRDHADAHADADADADADVEPYAPAEPAADRSSSDAAWRLMRGWRPGGRRRVTLEDELPVTTPDAHAPSPARAPSPAGAPRATPFVDAATQGAVPAASAVIGSIDQLAADREALRALGVPAAWTRYLDEGDRFTSILSMLGRLAELKISDDVAVIAVIGPADVVELEAHRTALDLPVEGRPRAVALIPAEAGIERRAAIARSKRIRPVVISIPIEGYDDPIGTRKILTGVHAEAVIAVVDARRPLEEITRWVEALERVDAIALDGALDVAGPAAVLGLDVPVIRVDGIAVDRIGWAALLCAQLSARESSR